MKVQDHAKEAEARVSIFEANFGGTEILTPMKKAIDLISS